MLGSGGEDMVCFLEKKDVKNSYVPFWGAELLVIRIIAVKRIENNEQEREF